MFITCCIKLASLNRNQMKSLKKFKITFLLTIIFFGFAGNEDSSALNSENLLLGN